MSQETREYLKNQLHQIQLSKLELIRSTSTEIEKLRRIIRLVSNADIDIETVDSVKYEPLSKSEISSIQNLMPKSTRPSQDFSLQQVSQHVPHTPSHYELHEEVQFNIDIKSTSHYAYHYQTPGGQINNNIDKNDNNTDNNDHLENNENVNNNLKINDNNNNFGSYNNTNATSTNNNTNNNSSINTVQKLTTITEEEVLNANNNNSDNNLPSKTISSRRSRTDTSFRLNTKKNVTSRFHI